MPDWTIDELMHLTREELCNLATELEQGLSQHEAGTVGRTKALVSLDSIRRAMLRRGFHR
ncbi:hypothetical protein NLM31_12805 [Bradyrhizobium sp. CCGUVB4N]|uniref:hypothetical protein n=1 Tax=Bradyrhizobium sp. CCGUVB4N TaxID=2949631 RepID=UPI0020B3D037|nr:hypothetical protein [Bradyrhizobium sp. CCGUVB4N]MCP3381220.1 hypothetical protein [Bradyrhizobium sp. CCGUVB4N]